VPDALEANETQRLTLLNELLRRTHLSTPSDLASVVLEQAADAGARDGALYLVDYELSSLVPLPRRGAAPLEPLSIAGTVPGRAFSTTAIVRAPAGEAGRQRVWIPLLDGTERLGVIALSLPEEQLSEDWIATWERYAHLVAMLIVSKGAYGDAFELARRRQPMTLASELLWGLAPPLVFASDGVVIAGMLEPCYDNGGDCLDYAVDGRVLHLAVFDAMGHGLAAAGVAAFAVAAYRQSRRTGRGLIETYTAMDEAVGEQFPDSRFVTALIAQLELDTGRLRWITAGHPPPLLIRGGRRAHNLVTEPVPPLGSGVEHAPPVVAVEPLEPGDLLLLYTDGVTEARDADGRLFGVEGLSRFIEREAAAGQTTPETLRRLRHAIIGSAYATLRDDATALLVEWNRGGERALLPATVADQDDV
jgi:serine/threonine protein phosphatase PrpC